MTLAVATGQPVDTVGRLLDDDPRGFATLLAHAQRRPR